MYHGLLNLENQFSNIFLKETNSKKFLTIQHLVNKICIKN